MNVRPCRAHARTIALYSLGHVTPEERGRVDLHLAECAGCTRYLEELRFVERQFEIDDAETSTPTPRFNDELFSAIAGESRAVQRPWIFWPALSAAAFVLLLSLILLSRQAHPPIIAVVREPDLPALQHKSPLSLGTYRLAAEESLESLDDLLSAQALRSSTPRLTLRNPEM